MSDAALATVTSQELERPSQSVALELREQVRIETEYKRLAVELLHNEVAWTQYMDRCQTIAQTGMYGHKDAQTVAIAGLKGFAMGWDLLGALERIKVIFGRPCVRGQAAVGYIRSKGYHFECVESTAELARWSCRRPNYPEKTFSYTRDKAKAAGLLDKRDSLWNKYPEELVKWACATLAANEYFADVLGGFPIAESYEAYAQDDDLQNSASAQPTSTGAPSDPKPEGEVEVDHKRQARVLLNKYVKRKLELDGKTDAVPGDEVWEEAKATAYREASKDLPGAQTPPSQEDYARLAEALRRMFSELGK